MNEQTNKSHYLGRECGDCIHARRAPSPGGLWVFCFYRPVSAEDYYHRRKVQGVACSKWRLNVSWELQTCETCRFCVQDNVFGPMRPTCKHSPGYLCVIKSEDREYFRACCYWELSCGLKIDDPAISR